MTRCDSDNIAWIFFCAILSGISGTTWHSVFLVQCCPRSIKTTLRRMFPVQCCLEPFEQHCIWVWTVQRFLKSIKTTLNRILFLHIVVWSLSDNIAYGFNLCNVVQRVLKTTLNNILSCGLLSKTSRTTLHVVFIYVISQEYHLLGQHCTGKPYVVLPLRLQTTWNKKNPVQCCLNTLWATLHG